MTERIPTVIIGAGQAGLAMSHLLVRRGVRHVVIERGRIGERWLSERWPSLRLLTPNWMMRLPGFDCDAADPDGFMRATEFARRLRGYALGFGAPVLEDTAVTGMAVRGAGYEVETTVGRWLASAVVLATGACDRPAVPRWAQDQSPEILQVTTDRYVAPERLPLGGVLVVGASATGVQLAREIHRSGRPVTLAVGRHVRSPRRYRGRDVMRWLDACGFLAEPRPIDADPSRVLAQPSLQLVGDPSGGDIDLPTLRAEGVRIVGRALGTEGRAIRLARDLDEDCAAAERRRHALLGRIDAHIAATGEPAPAEPSAWAPPPSLPEPPGSLDLGAERIRTVLWATGYRRSYPWLRLPLLGPDGEIATHGGATPAPGVFVLGLPFLRHRASTFIDGVGRDAEAVCTLLLDHLNRTAARAA